MITGHELREKFATFFTACGHQKIASSSIIPHNDKTLLFCNAGMNQFKDNFTGKANPKNPRAVSIQKCVRAGGKHNDLENVGLTARHHTFFEMLGNFSFGDYFKEEAIVMAWSFLTDELKIPKEKLYVTVHHSDNDALEIWNKKVKIPLDRIFKKGDKDNFWEMGEFGPCGPCSEIFFDHGEENGIPGFVPGKDQDILDDENRYVEIWNLVFMQYEKTPEGKFDLPKPSIDTGAGLERIAAVLQGVYWNYDSDIFAPLIKKIEELTDKKYSDESCKTPIRVVADHIRSATMLITDGVLPSNEGRGYVLRRIIRRAVRHMRELKKSKGSFYLLVPAVFESLGAEYPQNLSNQALAEKLLKGEEEKFLETLDLGIKYFEEAVKKNMKGDTLPGDSLFKLYDTYGFPVDLTETLLLERGHKADMAGFEKAMSRRKEESKKSWKAGANVDTKIYHEAVEKHGETEFLGYRETEHQAKLLAKLDLGDATGLLFDKTPFYGESGGQAGDLGQVLFDSNTMATIIDTQKPLPQLTVHLSKDADALEVGKKYVLRIDKKYRDLTARNHSATHLLQAALVDVLGDHVKQAGSHVDGQRLRFDFTHMKALSKGELKMVEDLVNLQVKNGLAINSKTMGMDEALQEGATALFGEKYGNKVRVIKMGDFSTELCGGTHIENTSEIGLLTLTSESSLATGVRRIEAVTSETAMARLRQRSQYLEKIEGLVKVKGELVIERVENLQADLKNKIKEISTLKEKVQPAGNQDLFDKLVSIGEHSYKAAEIEEGADLRKLSDMFFDKVPNGILLLYSTKKNKAATLLRVSKNITKIDCSKVLNEGLKLLNGKGGGRKDMAQGSGDAGDFGKFESKISELLNQSL
ncbi:MAG: alanine--tRNA ligase [Halobacteriovoraceae bacterium]|nr:alanine--tRNA ligase [Halobacteriovoraceae bacterium]